MNDNEWNDAVEDIKDLERTISFRLMLICLFAGSALAFSIAAFVLVLVR